MSKELFSMDYIKREKFDSLHIKTSRVDQFLAYYVALLVTAQQCELISKNDCEIISNNILSTFYTKFGHEPLVMANNMYVLTAYLKAKKDNYSQLQELIKVKNQTEAEKLFERAGKWLKQQIGYMKLSIFVAEREVIILDDNIVKLSYKLLKDYVKELNGCLSPKTKCNLKLMHFTTITGAGYDCAIRSESESYIERLVTYANNFLLELKILNRLRAHEVIESIEVFCENIEHVSEQDKKLEEIERNLERLEVNYKAKMQEALDQEEEADRKYLDFERKMRIKFQRENPNIPKDMFEDVFEAFMDNLEDEYYSEIETIDINALEKAYHRKRQYLEHQYEMLEKERAESAQTSLIDWSDICLSLRLVVKLTAVGFMLRNGEIFFTKIPASVEELEEMLLRIPIQEAVSIIENEINFSGEELSYLRRIKD